MSRWFRYALLALPFCVLAARADPPKLTVPADLKPVSGYVRFTPETTAKSVLYLALDDAFPFPSEELKDVRRFILPTAGLKDGVYRFLAVASLNDEMSVTPFAVVIGKADPADPPVKPPVKGTPYLLVVRANGPAQPEFVRAMADPAWDDHRKAGILVRDATVEESKAVVTLPAGTPIPCVVGLRVAGDGKSFSVAFQPVPFPSDSPSRKALAEKFQ